MDNFENFYSNQFLAPYFAEYVKTIFENKKLNQEMCIKILNEELVKNVSAYKDGLGKNGLKKSFVEFEAVVATARGEIAKKYDKTSFFDIFCNGSKKAKREGIELERFAKNGHKCFEQVFEKNTKQIVDEICLER